VACRDDVIIVRCDRAENIFSAMFDFSARRIMRSSACGEVMFVGINPKKANLFCVSLVIPSA